MLSDVVVYRVRTSKSGVGEDGAYCQVRLSVLVQYLVGEPEEEGVWVEVHKAQLVEVQVAPQAEFSMLRFERPLSGTGQGRKIR